MIPDLTTLPAGEPCRLCEAQGRMAVRGAVRRAVKRLLPGGVQVCPVCDTGVGRPS
ncbi:hypothetical protein [Microbispora rosea]|uniref:hypothetical protein n=1 Tax=Microbispora rosea TaxID=58117 RepID=UPI00379859DF